MPDRKSPEQIVYEENRLRHLAQQQQPPSDFSQWWKWFTQSPSFDERKALEQSQHGQPPAGANDVALPSAGTNNKSVRAALSDIELPHESGPLQGPQMPTYGDYADPVGILGGLHGTEPYHLPTVNLQPPVPSHGQLGTGYNTPSLMPDLQHSLDTSDLSPSNGGFLDSVKNGLSGLNTQDWLGIGGLGLGAAGMYLNSRQQSHQFDQNLELEKQKLALDAQQLNQNRRAQALSATQLNPYKQQNDLTSSALRRVLLDKGPATVSLGSSMPNDPGKADRAAVGNEYLNDQVLGDIGQKFEAERQDLINPPNNQALQNALLSGTNQTPAKHGGGFWSKLGKIASIAAPVIAAPFTGGASLAMIGAGAGAANAALNHQGLQGMLLGAGLGAIPGVGTSGGMASGAVRPALTAGLKQAGKSALRNPLPILTRAL